MTHKRRFRTSTWTAPALPSVFSDSELDYIHSGDDRLNSYVASSIDKLSISSFGPEQGIFTDETEHLQLTTKLPPDQNARRKKLVTQLKIKRTDKQFEIVAN